LAILLNEDIAESSLGHLDSFIQEKNFVIALLESLLVLLIVELAEGCLMPQEAIT